MNTYQDYRAEWEAKLNSGKLSRFEADHVRKGLASRPVTISDMIREVLERGFDLIEHDPDTMEDLMDSYFATRLQELLAAAIVDPKAAKQLKRIADTTPPEPDFG